MKRFTLIAVVLTAFTIFWVGCQQTAVTSAKVYIQQQNYEKAIEQGELAVKTNPGDPEAHFVLGQAYGLVGEYRKMNEAFTKSLDASPKSEAAIKQQRNKYYVDLFNAGANAIKNNELDQAEENYSICTAMIPDRSGAYTNLALVYNLKENPQLAMANYEKAIELDPEDLKVRLQLGMVMYREGSNDKSMYPKAIEVFQYILEHAEPGSEEYNQALLHIAYSYDLMGDQAKAIETYMKAISENPDDKDIWFNLGRLYFMQENFDKAIESFTEVIRLAPEDFESNLNVAQALLEMEKWAEAIPYYEKAVEVNPESAIAWNNLGVCYIRTGQPVKGKAAFDRATALE